MFVYKAEELDDVRMNDIDIWTEGNIPSRSKGDCNRTGEDE